MKQLTEHIAYAGREQLSDITELWMEAFEDEREYVEFYMEHRFSEDNMLVYLQDDRPVAMLSILPLTLHWEGRRIPAGYVYAVATGREYRRRGYAAELLSYAHEQYGVLVLEPADETLAKYYRRMGFREAFYVNEYDLPLERTDGRGIEARMERKQQKYWLLTVTPSEYVQLRDSYFMGEGYAQWDREMIAYALLENDFCGGYAYKVFHDGQEDLLLYRMEEGVLRVVETTLTDEALCDVCRKLQLPAKTAHVRRRASTGGRSFGMLWSDIPLTGGYLNLTLE